MKIDLPENLDEVEVRGNEPLPTGDYVLRIAKEPEVRDGSEHPYLNWEFDIVEPEEHVGRKHWENTSLSPKALGMPNGIKALLQAAGVPWEGDSFDATLAVGQKVGAKIGQRTNQEDPDDDRIYNDVKEFYEVY